MKYRLSKAFPQKRAFITGAGSGLGRQFALELAQDGWRLGLIDINEAAMRETRELCEKCSGVLPVNSGNRSAESEHRFVCYRLDVSDSEQYSRVVRAYLHEFTGIDLLINNAGVGDGGEMQDYDLADWKWLLDINLMGVIYGCHLFLDTFLQQKSGHIINIASAAAFASMPGMAAYSVSKAGVLSLSEVLACELEPDVGITVVMPEFIRTGIMQHSRTGDPWAREFGRLLVNTSKLTPEMVVPSILQKAGRGKFSVIFPFRAKIVRYLSSRHPEIWRWLRIRLHRHRNRLIQVLQWREKRILSK